MHKPSATETATELIVSTVYDMRVNAAYLRMTARDQVNPSDAAKLREAADAINRLTTRLEKVTR
jgi:hypothetical protein